MIELWMNFDYVMAIDGRGILGVHSWGPDSLLLVALLVTPCLALVLYDPCALASFVLLPSPLT